MAALWGFAASMIVARSYPPPIGADPNPFATQRPINRDGKALGGV